MILSSAPEGGGALEGGFAEEHLSGVAGAQHLHLIDDLHVHGKGEQVK